MTEPIVPGAKYGVYIRANREDKYGFFIYDGDAITRFATANRVDDNVYSATFNVPEDWTPRTEIMNDVIRLFNEVGADITVPVSIYEIKVVLEP